MNYIELFGIPTSGKNFIKNQFINNLKKKNCKVLDPKIIIINFFLKNFRASFSKKVRLFILIIINSTSLFKIKSSFKRKGIIVKKNNRIHFSHPKKEFYHKLIDKLNLDDEYFQTLLVLKKRLKIKRKYHLYNLIEKEINMLKQTQNFKSTYKRWFLENIILIDILKKNKDTYCVNDEGIVHKIFIIFSIKKKKLFVKQAINFVENHQNLYMIKSNLKKLKKRFKLRKEANNGFIYEDYQQIIQEQTNFMDFEKLISKKLNYKIITN